MIDRFARIERKLFIIKLMVGITLTGVLALLVKAFA
jgi:hypothetical protein